MQSFLATLFHGWCVPWEHQLSTIPFLNSALLHIHAAAHIHTWELRDITHLLLWPKPFTRLLSWAGTVQFLLMLYDVLTHATCFNWPSCTVRTCDFSSLTVDRERVRVRRGKPITFICETNPEVTDKKQSFTLDSNICLLWKNPGFFDPFIHTDVLPCGLCLFFFSMT